MVADLCQSLRKNGTFQSTHEEWSIISHCGSEEPPLIADHILSTGHNIKVARNFFYISLLFIFQ